MNCRLMLGKFHKTLLFISCSSVYCSLGIDIDHVEPRNDGQGSYIQRRLYHHGLPLLAAKDWGMFTANGLDVEVIVMSPSLAAARWRRAISITLPALGPLPSPRP